MFNDLNNQRLTCSLKRRCPNFGYSKWLSKTRGRKARIKIELYNLRRSGSCSLIEFLCSTPPLSSQKWQCLCSKSLSLNPGHWENCPLGHRGYQKDNRFIVHLIKSEINYLLKKANDYWLPSPKKKPGPKNFIVEKSI